MVWAALATEVDKGPAQNDCPAPAVVWSAAGDRAVLWHLAMSASGDPSLL